MVQHRQWEKSLPPSSASAATIEDFLRSLLRTTGSSEILLGVQFLACAILFDDFLVRSQESLKEHDVSVCHNSNLFG